MTKESGPGIIGLVGMKVGVEDLCDALEVG